MSEHNEEHLPKLEKEYNILLSQMVRQLLYTLFVIGQFKLFLPFSCSIQSAQGGATFIEMGSHNVKEVPYWRLESTKADSLLDLAIVLNLTDPFELCMAVSLHYFTVNPT